MCQLMGMNCNVPTDICFSFRGFHQRGGRTADHADGFGVAFFEGPGCRMFVDPARGGLAGRSADCQPIRSAARTSSRTSARPPKGQCALVNTHPFMRELWGRYWIFAHNGTLENFRPEFGNRYRPVGSTDSEQAFCHLLDTLRLRYPDGQPLWRNSTAPSRRCRRKSRRHGKFNYILSNGEYLFAHCTDKSVLRIAACAIHDRSPEGPGHRGGFQPGDHARRSHRNRRNRATDRQRALGPIWLPVSCLRFRTERPLSL